MAALSMEAVFAVLKRIWWSIPMALLLIALLLTRHTLANTKHDRDHWAGLFHEEKAAFDGTVANYRAAQKRAEDADRAHAKAVEASQNKVNQERSHEYEARIAELRARFERVRHGQGGQADRGGAGATNLPGVPEGSGRPLDPAADYAFRCEADAIQLEELIAWVRQQEAVPRDKP